MRHHRPPTRAEPARARGASEAGMVGGVEVLPFGLLVFVAGTLLIANAWAIVDAKLAVESAAREAGRAYVEADDVASARAAAAAAARAAIEGAGRDPTRLHLRDNDPPFEHCAVVEHEATYQVAALTIPFIGGFGHGTTVHGRHRELIDPYRAGLGSETDCGP